MTSNSDVWDFALTKVEKSPNVNIQEITFGYNLLK